MNTPAPVQPLQIYRVETYVDSRQRLIVAKTIIDPSNPFAVGAQSFIGQGVAGVMTPQGPQQIPFEIPLVGPTIHEAFGQFDAEQEPAFKVHLEKMRMQALRQGATLNELPTDDRKSFKKQ